MELKLTGKQIESLVDELINEKLVGEEKGMKFFVGHYEKDGKTYEVPYTVEDGWVIGVDSVCKEVE